MNYGAAKEQGISLEEAKGRNTNSFFYVEKAAKPAVSPKASTKPLSIPKTRDYDMSKEKGKIYTLTIRLRCV